MERCTLIRADSLRFAFPPESAVPPRVSCPPHVSAITPASLPKPHVGMMGTYICFMRAPTFNPPSLSCLSCRAPGHPVSQPWGRHDLQWSQRSVPGGPPLHALMVCGPRFIHCWVVEAPGLKPPRLCQPFSSPGGGGGQPLRMEGEAAGLSGSQEADSGANRGHAGHRACWPCTRPRVYFYVRGDFSSVFARGGLGTC